MGLQKTAKAVAFDFDGLMFNTEDVFEIVGIELLARRSLEMTSPLRQAMIGRRAVEAYQVLVAETGLKETPEELIEESRVIFNDLLDDHLAPMPGLFALLDRVEQSRIPRAVSTSSPRSYLVEMLSRFDLVDRFPVTLTAEDVTHGKPHPEIYLATAAALNVEPAELLVLEDSGNGARAAVAAGAQVVVVPHRHTHDHSFPPEARFADQLDSFEISDLLGLG